MKAIYNMLFAAAALTLAACTGDELLDKPNAPDAQVELRLTSGLEVQTRGAHGLDTQVKEGEAVHVWVDDATTGKSLYSSNTLTAGNDGALTGGETMYFPATCNSASIYAIHGNFAENTDYTNFWGAEQTHTVMQDQRSDGRGYAQSDLVYCKLTDVSRNGNPTTVGLTFEHLLSKVEVVLVQGAGKPTISKAEILNTRLNATFTPDKTDETVTVTASGTTGENPIEIDNDLSDVNEAVIVPQTLKKGTEFIRITTPDGDKLVYSLPAGKTFKPGEKYRFTITVEKGNLIVKTVEDAAAGDYLLSDGSVLDKESILTQKAASQVVGIVFHVGHHALDGSNYTNTGIGQEKCHGYAVSLTFANNGDNDKLAWEKGPNRESEREVGTTNTLTDWNGYSNQQKFHEFIRKNQSWNMKNFPAAFACEYYGKRTVDRDGNPTTAYDWQKPLAAPSNTSGWFMPSVGQLLDLLECPFLTKSMSAVKNSLPDDCGYKDYIGWLEAKSYWESWSSTEDVDADEPASPDKFAMGAAYNDETGLTYNTSAVKRREKYVRPVLAF